MNDEAKRSAALRAVEYIQDGQVIGLGTGSTAKFAIEAIALRARDGLKLTAVATSLSTERMARELGIAIVDLNEVPGIDVTIDGADEVDQSFNMIKGGGGALTREKLVALASVKRIIIVDEHKLVAILGKGWPLPVEVLPFAWTRSALMLNALGCIASLRGGKENPFVTDNGNYILDCKFAAITDPAQMEKEIKLIPGVIESGLFVAIADVLIIGFDDHTEIKERVPS